MRKSCSSATSISLGIQSGVTELVSETIAIETHSNSSCRQLSCVHVAKAVNLLAPSSYIEKNWSERGDVGLVEL